MDSRVYLAIALFVVWLTLRIYLRHKAKERRRRWQAQQDAAAQSDPERE